MPGNDVRYTTRDNETFDGYLTAPAGTAKVPGILLITAIFGVDPEMRELADAWASDGFVVSMGQHLDEVNRITCPVSFHFGDADPVAPMDEVNAIRKAFAGRANADILVYQGVGHNFSMPRKEGYDPVAARESRERVLRCFKSM